ncbi:MAG: hypothetical protein ACOH2G_05105 [Ewingella sp.]
MRGGLLTRAGHWQHQTESRKESSTGHRNRELIQRVIWSVTCLHSHGSDRWERPAHNAKGTDEQGIELGSIPSDKLQCLAVGNEKVRSIRTPVVLFALWQASGDGRVPYPVAGSTPAALLHHSGKVVIAVCSCLSAVA